MPGVGDLPTGIVTFLFTDLEKSTRLLQHDAEAMRAALIRHHDLLRAAIERHGGVVFETVGDAVYGAFARPHDALAAAIQGQRALRNAQWGEVGELKARMAIHSGEVAKRDAQHYVGEPLVRCARLLVLGHGGQTLVSEAAATLVRSALPGSASLRDLGDHRLKDLPGTERVYQLDQPDIHDAFPPLISDALVNNLPVALTSFIGRAREIDELRTLLTEVRFLTLTGAGGSGKTRLALELAERVTDLPHGRWFVDLAPLVDAEQILPTIAATFGVRQRPGDIIRGTAESVDVLLRDYLRAKRLLLVIDNCEHLVDACARIVADLLIGSTGLICVATSREPLGVQGERVFRVGGLTEARRLFAERARSLNPDFDEDRDPLLIDRICDRLDRLPLAIELAAARTRVLSPYEIADRLDDRFRLLTGAARTATRRQQTLRATLDWSHALLSDREQVLWRRLAAFAGGCTLEAIETVCADDRVTRAEALDVLSSLVDKSLVVADAMNGRTRYRMLETLREYALERLAESGEANSIRRGHASFFLEFAERERLGTLGGGRQRESFDRLDAEVDNLRSAMRWSVEHDITTAVRLGLATSRFAVERSHLSDARFWSDRVVPRLSEVDAPLRAAALNLAGTIAMLSEDFSSATQLHRAALDGSERLDDDGGRSDAMRSLAALAAGQGDDRLSERLYERTLQLDQASGRDYGVARCHMGLGRVAMRQANFAKARQHYQRALAMWEKLGDRTTAAQTLQDLALVELGSGNGLEAERLARACIASYREVGSRANYAVALQTLAAVLRDRGDNAQARSVLAEAEAICRDLEMRSALGIVLINEAELAFDVPDPDHAELLVQDALRILGALDSNRGVTWCWDLAAQIAVARGEWVRAARLLGATMSYRERIGLRSPPKAQAETDRAIAATRGSLEGARFDRVWAESQTMTREEATAYALSGRKD